MKIANKKYFCSNLRALVALWSIPTLPKRSYGMTKSYRGFLPLDPGFSVHSAISAVDRGVLSAIIVQSSALPR